MDRLDRGRGGGWSWAARAVATFALLVAACGGPPARSPDDGVAAPYPYSVYQIRAGCPMGRTIEYHFEKEGEAPRMERWTFQPLEGGESVKVTTEHFDAVGNPSGPATTESAKWTELQSHARFPKSATTISNEDVTTPAGTFDSMRYVVTKGPDEVDTFWFARSLPGPPVKMEISKGGKTVMTMTMQANRTRTMVNGDVTPASPVPATSHAPLAP